MEIGVHAWRIRIKNQQTGTWGDAPGEPHRDLASARQAAVALMKVAAGVELEEVVAAQGVDGPRWVPASKVSELERYPVQDEG